MYEASIEALAYAKNLPNINLFAPSLVKLCGFGSKRARMRETLSKEGENL